jgi:hypothetical protein
VPATPVILLPLGVCACSCWRLLSQRLSSTSSSWGRSCQQPRMRPLQLQLHWLRRGRGLLLLRGRWWARRSGCRRWSGCGGRTCRWVGVCWCGYGALWDSNWKEARYLKGGIGRVQFGSKHPGGAATARYGVALRASATHLPTAHHDMPPDARRGWYTHQHRAQGTHRCATCTLPVHAAASHRRLPKQCIC